MSLLGFLYDLFFGEKATEPPRGPCPSCLREGLETYLDKAVSEGFHQRKVLVTPAHSWHRCIYCGSKFKMGRFATQLEPVSDEEWDRHVAAPKPGTKPTD